MSFYFCKLIPPRPSFMQDMTEAERQVMGEHGAYWRKAMDSGKIIAFGPVIDPNGLFGAGFAEMENAAEVAEFGRNDPAIRSGNGFRFEYYPMPNLVYEK